MLSSSSPSRLTGGEPLPPAVHALLHDEQVLHAKCLQFPWPEGEAVFYGDLPSQYHPESRPVFALPYYLLPRSLARYTESASLSPKVRSHLLTTVDGEPHFRLFVHPDAMRYFAFLKAHGARFVGPDETEYVATPTSSYRSVVVWRPQISAEQQAVFVAKLSIPRHIFGADRVVDFDEISMCGLVQELHESVGPAAHAAAGVAFFPEVAGLCPMALPDAPPKLGGQIIREIPNSVQRGESRWIPFHALLSQEESSSPLLLRVVEASGVSAATFTQRYLIDAYLRLLDHVSFGWGLAFQPHLQNLLLETTPDWRPTGRLVLRDFSDMWPDIFILMQNGLMTPAHRRLPASTLRYHFNLGRYAEAHFYTYRKLLYDLCVDALVRHDSNFRQTQADALAEKLDRCVVTMIESHRRVPLDLTVLRSETSFPAMRSFLVAQGQAASRLSSMHRRPGIPVPVNAGLRDFLTQQVERDLWHRTDEGPTPESPDAWARYLELYRMEVSDGVLLAIDIYQCVVGLTYLPKHGVLPWQTAPQELL